MKAMILAAGLGSRFRPHTDVLAKPALPFLNIPLLAYSLFHIESLGNVTDVVLNTHHLPATVRAAAAAVVGRTAADAGVLRSSPQPHCPSYAVHFSDEQPKILGSGGGIARAGRELNGSGVLGGAGHFLVCNGDEVLFFKTPGGFRRLVDAHVRSGALATLMTMDHSDVGVTMNGLRVGASGEILEYSIREQGLAHFTGVFVFSERILNYMPRLDEFHIFKDVLVPAQARGEKVMVHHVNDLLWLETTDEKSFIESTDIALDHFSRGSEYSAEIRSVFARFGQAPVELSPGVWGGRGSAFNGRAESGSICLLGADSMVASGAQVRGFTVVGKGAVVGEGVTLDHSVVGPSAVVNSASVFDHRLIL